MKNLLLVSALILLIGCLEGPAGPAGSDGVDGTGLTVSVKTGVLYPADLEGNTSNTNGYWDVSYSALVENAMVQVWVRQGSGFMWQPPTFYVSSSYVRITNSSYANYEYKIVVSK